MKNNIFISLICFLCVFSCVKNDDGITIVDVDQLTDVYSNSEVFLIDGASTNFVFEKPAEAGVVVRLGGLIGYASNPKTDAIDWEYQILPENTTAVEGDQFTATKTGVIPAEEIAIPIPIDINLDNCDIGTIYEIQVQLVDTNFPNYKTDPVTYTFQVICTDESLASEVNFVSEDNFAGVTTSGIRTITADPDSPGSYILESYDFGTYVEEYGAEAAGWGTLRLNYICKKLSFSGLDNYDDTWTVTEVTESNGPNFTFRWENTYGEFGTVTLTKVGGGNWPEVGI